MAIRSPTTAVRPPPSPATLTSLYLSFLLIGATSFGGGLTAWIRRELVERRRWIDDQQFLSSYALSQLVPGATNVNLAVLIGTQLRGVVGAVVALAGLMLVPLTILLVLGAFYFAAHGSPGGHWLNAALAGAGAAAIGFNIATGIRLARRNLRGAGPLMIAALVVVAVGILRVTLLHTLLAIIPISLLYAIYGQRR